MQPKFLSLQAVIDACKAVHADGLWYLATPYSKYPLGQVKSFEHSAMIGGELLNNGVATFGPISHSHPVSLYGKVQALDHSVWLPLDAKIMPTCDGIIVGCMDAWDTSYGVTWEIGEFEKWRKPVLHLDVTEILAKLDPDYVG